MSGGTRDRERRPSLGGGGRGPTEHWPRGGGGGGDRGGDFPNYSERLRRYRLGMLLALSSVVMLFVSFTTAYVVRKAGEVWDPARNNYVSYWEPVSLPLAIMVANTLVLLLSSATLERARRRAAEDVALAPLLGIPGVQVSANRALPWVWATLVLGVGFLAGQVLAWRQLERLNPGFATSISSGFFFMLTGVHAVHLTGGILALLYAAVAVRLRRPPETRRMVVDVTSWYWHFMGALWLYIFGLLYFGR